MTLRYTAAKLVLSICLISASVWAQGAAPAAAPSLPAPINVPGVGSLPNIPGIKFTTDVKEKPEDLLGKALKAYQNGNLKDSLNLIQQAQDGIRVKHADTYVELLPTTPGGGWAIADPDPSKSKVTLPTQMAGGVNIVTRTFTANGHKISISYIADSPMLGLLSPLMSAFAPLITGLNGANDNVKGNPALYIEPKPDETHRRPPSHTLLVIMPDTLVAVSSETLPKETILQFANIVDYDRLKKVK